MRFSCCYDEVAAPVTAGNGESLSLPQEEEKINELKWLRNTEEMFN